MSIEVTCVQCGSSHHVNDRLAGRRVRCPNCDTAVHVPELEVGVEPQSDEEPLEVEPVVGEESMVVAESAPVEPMTPMPAASAKHQPQRM